MGRRVGGSALAAFAILAIVGGALNGAAAALPGSRSATPAFTVTPESPVAGAWVYTPTALPLRNGDVQMAPTAGGQVYVLATQHQPDGARSVLALLDARGRPRGGWPMAISGTTCDPSRGGLGSWDPSPDLLVAPDGSVRVVCSAGSGGATSYGGVRVFAFDAHARALPGWPVDLDDYDWNLAPRMVGTRFVALSAEHGREPPYPAALWIQSIAADGSLTIGTRYEIPDTTGFTQHVLGSDGFAYLAVRSGSSTRIVAIDLGGVRPGWPVTVKYPVAGLVFGPPGLVHMVTERGGGARTQLRALTSSGRAVATAAAILPVGWMSAWQGEGEGEPVALVARDGSTWMFGMRGSRTLVYALDPSGRVRAGWPRDVTPRLVSVGAECGPSATGCGWWLSRPAVGSGDVLYLAREATSASTGGSIVALGPNGKVRAGWPVTLRRPGSEFWTVEIGTDGTIFALAVEPEAGGHTSATILAITPDSTVRWSTTVVEP